MKKIVVDESFEKQRLDKFLKRYLPEAGAGFLYRMLRQKKITLNDKKAAGSEILAQRDVITIYFSDETIQKFSGKTDPLQNAAAGNKTKLNVVFENGHMAILDKPAGILTQKSQPGDISLNDLFLKYLTDKGEVTKDSLRLYKPSVLNRLDRNTSGLVICAKSLSSARELTDLIAQRLVKKEYLTLVKGRFDKEGVQEAWLQKDSGENKVQIYDRPVDGAVPIVTGFRVISYGKDTTLLQAELITGRPHQIRAHLSWLGFPVAGDAKYGLNNWNEQLRKQTGLKRQFLHAAKLTFPKISGGTPEELSERCFESALPSDLTFFNKDYNG